MKFCKKYREYMQAQGQGQRGGKSTALPAVDLKRLKKLLKKCSNQRRADAGSTSACGDCNGRRCSEHVYAVCDGAFFPSLLQEMSAVVGCFNERTRNLLDLHLASGFRKYFVWLRARIQHNHDSLIQEGKQLVTYAIINSIAMRKILKKYDKIHYSKQGQAFRSQALSMHIEILQSPWLSELMAFYINTRVGGNERPWATSGLFEDCSLTFEDDRPVLSCGLFDSLKLIIDLTCSICLDTVFDTVALSCGHIFCYMCACRAASVSIVDGLKSAGLRAKCPLCRQGGVFNGAVHLDELNILLSRNCQEYWQQRRQTERTERLRLTKEHWDNQCRAFMGI